MTHWPLNGNITVNEELYTLTFLHKSQFLLRKLTPTITFSSNE